MRDEGSESPSSTPSLSPPTPAAVSPSTKISNSTTPRPRVATGLKALMKRSSVLKNITDPSSSPKKKEKPKLLRSGTLTWLQDCNKLPRALQGTWTKTRKVTFKVYEDRCVRQMNAALLGMIKSTKEYKFEDMRDVTLYDDMKDGNAKLFAVMMNDADKNVDFYEAGTESDAAEWWQTIKEALRPHRRATAGTDGDGVGCVASGKKLDTEDDLLAGLHSVMDEDWVDVGYLGKKADWMGSFRTRKFRVDTTEGMLEYFHPEDDMNRIKKRSRKKWWVRGHRYTLVDRGKWEIEISCATAKKAAEADHRLTVRAQDQNQFVNLVKLLHKVGAVPDAALIPDVMSSNRMNAIMEKKIVSSGNSVTEMTRHFDDIVGAKVSRYVEYKVHVGEGKSPNVNKVAASNRIAKVKPNEKFVGVIVGDMKCVTKGMFFSEKTERRRISVLGPFLGMNEIHDTTTREPREYFVIAGMAVRMYDLWDFQFTLRGYHARKTAKGSFKLADCVELTVVGYHEFPEQTMELLYLLRQEGAQLCDPSKSALGIVRSFYTPVADNNDALRDALEELEKYEDSKEARGWVSLSRICPGEQIQRYQKEIADEFTSKEFFNRFFDAAAVCTKETEMKLSSEKSSTLVDAAAAAALKNDDDDDDEAPSNASRIPPPRVVVDDDDDGVDLVNMTTESFDAIASMATRSAVSSLATTPSPGGTKRRRHEGSLHPMMAGKHAIFVLGPSAVGKTFSTKNALSSVLEKNGWMSDMMFLSIDGGIMRDVSHTWNTMKELPHQVRGDYRYLGVSDLFTSYFKSTISRTKKKLFKYCVKNGKNIIIPETAATPLPGVPSKVRDMLNLLRANDYRVVMTAVSGSRGRCNKNGKSREIQEGKKYGDLSWKWASDKVTKCFNYARSLGYTKETFFVTDNTDWDDVVTTIVPPHFGAHVKYVNVDYPDFSKYYDGDYKPVYTSQQLPGIPFASMTVIAREKFNVSAELDQDKCDAGDQRWTEMNVQLLNYGRSVWLVWDAINDGEGDDNEETENYMCLNASRTILGADNPAWTACLDKERKREKLALSQATKVAGSSLSKKKESNSSDDAPTGQQKFWSDMWLMPKVAERQIVVLDARKDTKKSGVPGHLRHVSGGVGKMWGSSHNLATLKCAKSMRNMTASPGLRILNADESPRSSLAPIDESDIAGGNESVEKKKPGPPPLPPKPSPPGKTPPRPRATTPTRAPPASPTIRSMRESARLCDRESLFMQLDQNGDGTLTHEELAESLREIIPDVTEEEIGNAIGILDRESTGLIHLEEFCAVIVGTPPVTSSTEEIRLSRRLSKRIGSMQSIQMDSVDDEYEDSDDDASSGRRASKESGGGREVEEGAGGDDGDGSMKYSLCQLRMVLNMKDVDMRDQWLKKLEAALEAVHPDTPKKIATQVSEYLRTKDRARVTFTHVRRHAVALFGEVVVSINETIIQQVIKKYFELG
eukprot:g1899.t1